MSPGSGSLPEGKLSAELLPFERSEPGWMLPRNAAGLSSRHAGGDHGAHPGYEIALERCSESLASRLRDGHLVPAEHQGGTPWGSAVDRLRGDYDREVLRAVLSSQFSVLSSQFSVLSSQFSVLSSQFSVLLPSWQIVSALTLFWRYSFFG